MDGPSHEIRLSVDHRDEPVAERTRIINRLRRHQHELGPARDPPARSPIHPRTPALLQDFPDRQDRFVAEPARSHPHRCTRTTATS
ncbi:hypothetical protein OG252_01360 [Streptomyces sp. NBC_01352]|uniref:hypothetical protein n=1 Tax=Streptomyces sp. NBC_01352 TaxID=2903834 RepID=UPI002E363257|nr:hypothetical protein [Streptomyces sp. NBC_01352]